MLGALSAVAGSAAPGEGDHGRAGDAHRQRHRQRADLGPLRGARPRSRWRSASRAAAPTSTTGWRRWPGLVAAFIFAVQMLNFQVLPGVSGHLLGGALAAMLVGPWVGALCVDRV